MCEPALPNAKYILKMTLPLHKKLKKICRQNLTLRKELRVSNQKLQEIQEKDRGKFDLLADVAKV